MRPHGCLLLVKLFAGNGGASLVAFRDRRVRPSTRGKGERKREPPRGGSRRSLVPQPSRSPRPRDVGGTRVGVCSTVRSALAVLGGWCGPMAILCWAEGRAWVPLQVSVMGYLSSLCQAGA